MVNGLLRDDLRAIDLPQEVFGDREWLLVVPGHREEDDLDAVALCVLDGLGEVVVAGDEVDDVGDALPGLDGEVESDADVDALLLAGVGEAAEAELDSGELPDLVLGGVGHSARTAAGVVPVDPQERQPRVGLGVLDEPGDERLVVGLDAAA
nr:hypothetical protein [Mobilicoccus massiliensis]